MSFNTKLFANHEPDLGFCDIFSNGPPEGNSPLQYVKFEYSGNLNKGESKLNTFFHCSLLKM